MAPLVFRARMAHVAAVEEKVRHTLPRADDEHAHGLREHHNRGDADEPKWALALPVGALALLDLPRRKLQDVGHQRQHHGDLHTVEERDEAPVDVACCHSKHRANEDGPTSAAHERRNGERHRAQRHAEGLVLLWGGARAEFTVLEGAVAGGVLVVRSVEAFAIIGDEALVEGAIAGHLLERLRTVGPRRTRHAKYR